MDLLRHLRTRACLAALLVLASLWGAAAAGAQGIHIQTPQNGAVVSSPDAWLVWSADAEADQFSLTLNDRPAQTLDGPYYAGQANHVLLKLADGMNRLNLAALEDGEPAAEVILEVYYRSPLAAGSPAPPPGFARYRFHTADNQAPCRPCHDLTFDDSLNQVRAPEESPCHLCHQRPAEGRFMHGPSAAWACQICHKAAPDAPGGATLTTVQDSCDLCHADSTGPWSAMAYRHGPAASGNCHTCHDPHGSVHPYFLRLHATDLCGACHSDKVSRPHAIAGFGGGGHPMRGERDPLEPEKGFTCASCHNPHAGEAPRFLYNYLGSMSEFCSSCHGY